MVLWATSAILSRQNDVAFAGRRNHDENATSLLTTVAIAATSTVISAALLWRKKQQWQESVDRPPFNERIPSTKEYRPHWLLGHLLVLHGDGDFKLGYKRVWEDVADPQTGLASVWFTRFSPTLCVLFAKDAKNILNASSYRESIWLLDQHNNNFLGQRALTHLNGKEWKRYRSAVHKSFTPKALQQSQSSIVQVGTRLVNSLLKAIDEHGGRWELPILPVMKMATIDVFGLSALQVDFECCQQLKLTEVAAAFEYLSEEYTRRQQSTLNPASFLYWIPTPSNRKHRSQRQCIREFLTQQIAQTRERIETGKNDDQASKHDLLTNILFTQDLDNKSDDDVIGDDTITDILMTLLFGGYDTTSITLSYALWLLATHPEIKANCLREIDAVLGSPNNSNKSNVKEDPMIEEALPYTKAVILETLRLYPPAPMTARTMEKSMVIGGHEFPIGTNCLIPIWSIHRHPQNFPQPNELRPDRWVRKRNQQTASPAKDADQSKTSSEWEVRPSDDVTDASDKERAVPPANRDAFFAFAAGARNCVGRKLAMQESVTLLALLLRQIEVEEVDAADPVLCSVVQQPAHGLPMILKAR